MDALTLYSSIQIVAFRPVSVHYMLQSVLFLFSLVKTKDKNQGMDFVSLTLFV